MNFHSLLRVNNAKKIAERFFEYEKEITNFVDNILNNRNLILDKRVLKTPAKGKELNIYIANDLGFCGNFNSSVHKEMVKDENADKILIGSKIMKKKTNNVLLSMSKEEYKDNIYKIEAILQDAIQKMKYSKINLVYNHYFNISNIELIRKTLLPLDRKSDGIEDYKEDFVVEGEINDILLNIIVLYLSYEIKIAEENSYASENIMRQMITKESLKKIEEIEEENIRVERKIRKAKVFKKTLEIYTNRKVIQDNENT